ncbi:unnamed protein product [Owenia fusiformis]|uniref:Uncharacterized protein n=1 Tax=Owenia fusiformis TaxID=6347 RepID=A0A8J1XVD4_OWEFU|nr:unnamed protein product [Owenia fusiformis]
MVKTKHIAHDSAMVGVQKKTTIAMKPKSDHTKCELPIIKDARERYKVRKYEKLKKEKLNQKEHVKLNLPIPTINLDDQYFHSASKRWYPKDELKLPHVPSGLDLRRTSDISVRSDNSHDSVFSLGGFHSSNENIDGSTTQSKTRRISLKPVQRPQSVGSVSVPVETKPDKPPDKHLLHVEDIEVMKPPSMSDEALTLKDALLRKTKTGDGKIKGKFKKLAKMVKTNLIWAKDLDDKHQEEEVDQTFVVKTDKEALSFDLNNFRASNKSYGGISVRAKRILAKNALERSEGDLLHLRDVIDRLKCFEKYSRKIKHELARVIEYESFQEGRIILQQGHVGIGFYFILKGSVSVLVTEVDKTTGQNATVPIAVLEEGQSFGELALMHDIRRAATIKCLQDSEFLRVDKPDFDMVLRVGQSYEWQRRLTALKAINIFKNLPIDDLNNCNNISRIVEFNDQTVIMGDQQEVSDYVYFVTAGKCKVVRVLTLLRQKTQYGSQQVVLPTRRYLDLVKKKYDRKEWRELHGEIVNKTPERHLMVIAELKQGNYFGVGEDLTDTYILAKGRVDCLMVPRLIFTKLGKSRLIESLRTSLTEILPKNIEIFDKYINGQRWRCYKEDVVNEVVKRRSIPNKTKMTDVPKSILKDNS